MTAWSWTGVAVAGWLGVAVWFALRLGPFLHRADPGEDACDLLADLPVDCLGPLEVDHEFFALVDPIEAEIDRRWTR